MITINPMPNFNMPPPSTGGGGHGHGNYNHGGGYHGGGYHKQGFHKNYHQQPFRPFTKNPSQLLDPDFDGKKLRKSSMRKTVDYNAAVINGLESRVWQRDFRDRRALQPDVLYYPHMLPPPSFEDNPTNAVTTRFVKAATNKMRCPIFSMCWTPEGRRLVTGASSGEFTLWNGLTFNFETILQAHDCPVRHMVWSHNAQWMVTADHAGYVKYWQSNMNNVKTFQGHKESIRGISFSPSDTKFASCSDDGTVRVWDFSRCVEEKVLRGHGADVKCVDWHPYKSLIVSGSKDNQQPVKLWDPKSGQSLATLHAHKSTVMDLAWNENGNWLVTASRDHLLKVFDIRNLSSEMQTFRGHKKEASAVAWHPQHEGLFSSGGADGSIMFWHVGADKEIGSIPQAHDNIIWTMAWHPLGHILATGSNDHTSKFWTRNRLGDPMKDRYNQNALPTCLTGTGGFDEMEYNDIAMIPGMGLEDDEGNRSIVINTMEKPLEKSKDPSNIPGLDIDLSELQKIIVPVKKVPFSKPIPKHFQEAWMNNMVVYDPKTAQMSGDGADMKELHESAIKVLKEKVPGTIPVTELRADVVIMFGKHIKVKRGSELEHVLTLGEKALMRFINSGRITELSDCCSFLDDDSDDEDFRGDVINWMKKDKSKNSSNPGDVDLRGGFPPPFMPMFPGGPPGPTPPNFPGVPPGPMPPNFPGGGPPGANFPGGPPGTFPPGPMPPNFPGGPPNFPGGPPSNFPTGPNGPMPPNFPGGPSNFPGGMPPPGFPGVPPNFPGGPGPNFPGGPPGPNSNFNNGPPDRLNNDSRRDGPGGNYEEDDRRMDDYDDDYENDNWNGQNRGGNDYEDEDRYNERFNNDRNWDDSDRSRDNGNPRRGRRGGSGERGIRRTVRTRKRQPYPSRGGKRGGK